MAEGGALAPILGPIFGTGASRGVGVVISLVGVLSVVAAVVAFNVNRLRRVELELPDHDAMAQPQ
jgi:DHA3 family macrolide efflux protein-like MFS transporter